MSWLNKYPDGGKLKPKPKVSLDDLRPKGLGVQAQDNTRRLPLVDPKIAYNKSWDEYRANQPQVSQARVQSIPQQQANLLKKKDYVYTHPNAKLVDGEIERKNIYRNTEGVPDKGTPAAKQDRFLNDSFEALNAASIIMPAGELLGAGAKAAGRYLTEQTALKNAYKLNPYAFKPNPEMMYRGIGKEGAADAIESGVFRAKQNVEPNIINGFDYSKQFKGTYYTPKFQTADQYGAGYIAEVPKNATDFRLRYKGKGNKTWSQIADENIPIEKGKILKKDWLQGYKEIPQPTSTQQVISTSSGMDAVYAKQPGYNSQYFVKQGYVPPTTDPSLKAFSSSEIDWAKWNKEIPTNKALMNEYNTIEQTSKANGTWMKNADGSPFSGTPEQFVQQNSSNFKKAFGNSKIVDRNNNPLILHHGSKQEFSEFLPPNRSGIKPTMTDNKMDYSYFHHNKDIAAEYASNFNPSLNNYKGVKSVYINSKNPLIHKDVSNPAKYIKDINLKNYDLISNREFGKNYNFDKLTDARLIDESEIAVPFGNNVKSAKGNNGMFDMSNPNIYKALVPAVAGAGVLQQKKNGGTLNNWLNKY